MRFVDGTEPAGIVFRLRGGEAEFVIDYDDYCLEDILDTVDGLIPVELVEEVIIALDCEMSIWDISELVTKLRDKGLEVTPTLQGTKTSLEAHSERHLSVAFL